MNVAARNGAAAASQMIAGQGERARPPSTMIYR